MQRDRVHGELHARQRDELLNAEDFLNMPSVKRWREEYDHWRPHNSLGYVPPAVFAVETKASSVID